MSMSMTMTMMMLMMMMMMFSMASSFSLASFPATFSQVGHLASFLDRKATAGWQFGFEHESVASHNMLLKERLGSKSTASLIFASFVLCLLLHMTEVSGYRALIPVDPASPGKCVYRSEVLQLGVNNGIPPCQRLTCHEDGSILIEGCGKLRIDKCNHGERINPTKPFPECCQLRYKCKKDNGVPYYIERDAAEGA